LLRFEKQYLRFINALQLVVRIIRSRSEWSERMEHVEENWELYQPELFKHAVMNAALPPLLVSN